MTAPAWLTSLPRPALMAIGDSLLNGMRSYSIDDARAAASIPAYLGASLHPGRGDAPFQPARYPAPILIDVEAQMDEYTTIPNPQAALLEVLNNFGQIKADIVKNGRDWLNRFASQPAPPGPVVFDNLAIAGAMIPDAFEVTQAQLEARIQAMGAVVRHEADPLRWFGAWPAGDPNTSGQWGVGDLHISFNARHLRNPGNRDGLGSMTVLDMVGARRPRMLLVDMGANHGLVDVVMRGKGDRGMNGLRAFAAAWPPCARALAALPGVDVVVMLLMPRPSQTPCLAPPNPSGNPDQEPAPIRPDHYFGRYVSALNPVSAGFGDDGDAVARFDREMDAINADVKAAMQTAFAGSGKHLCFVSLADLLQQHDFKHRRGPKLIGASGQEYSNYPLGRLTSFLHGTRLRGGICGLDQIHPTTIGYRFVAEAVRQALTTIPGTPPSDPIAITDANDPFLLTPHWPTIDAMDALYPRGASGGQEAVVLAHPEMSAANQLIFQADWLR